MVTLQSGHFIPLNQPDPVAAGLSGFFNRHALIQATATHVGA
jgi:hypothetical protein